MLRFCYVWLIVVNVIVYLRSNSDHIKNVLCFQNDVQQSEQCHQNHKNATERFSFKTQKPFLESSQNFEESYFIVCLRVAPTLLTILLCIMFTNHFPFPFVRDFVIPIFKMINKIQLQHSFTFKVKHFFV